MLIIPIFVDKQKFVGLAEQKIKSELDANISFDKDIDLTFLPFPTLKIKSLKYFNKNFDVNVKNVNISVTWASIFDLRPEITNMEIFSPVLKINKKQVSVQNENLKIYVNNQNDYFDKFKKISKTFEVIRIKDGQIKFEKSPNFNLNNLNAILKGKGRFSANGNFNIDRLNSKIIFDFFEVDENKFDLIMQKKINDKNKLDFTGKIVFLANDFLLDGEVESNFLSLDELLLLNKQLVSISNKNFISIDAVKKNTKKVNFNIKKLQVKNTIFDQTQFTVKYLHPLFKIHNFVTSFDDAKISGMSLINLKTQKVNGEVSLKNLYVKENYFGETKYDLFDGRISCNLKFNYLIGKYKNNLKSFISDGVCKTGEIKLKGLNIDKVANNVDNIRDFSTLVNTINPQNFNGDSILKFIEIKFLTENGKLKIKKGKAFHKNVELNSFGSLDLISENINLKNKAYFKTTKFKKLPPLGINISGKFSEYKVNYNFDALKQELFNKGVKKILKEKKSIIIDPEELKKMFDSKSIDPNKLFNLFKN